MMAGETKAADPRWPSFIPIAACGAFAASTLSIYFRNVAAEAMCAGTLVCGDFRADPRVFFAGVGFAVLAGALFLGTPLIVATSRKSETGTRRLALLVSLCVAASLASFVAIITLNNVGAGVYNIIPVAIWAFLGIGFLVLWVATAFGTSLVGAWRIPARILASFHGAVAVVATLVTLMTALGPGPMFM